MNGRKGVIVVNLFKYIKSFGVIEFILINSYYDEEGFYFDATEYFTTLSKQLIYPELDKYLHGITELDELRVKYTAGLGSVYVFIYKWCEEDKKYYSIEE